MKKVIIILMFLFPSLLFSEKKAVNTTPRPFRKVEITNGTILAYMPDSGIRWHLKTGTNDQITTYGQVIQLRDGDKIRLKEKHNKYVIQASITNGSASLYYTRTFDARSFGKGITTTNGIIKLNKKQSPAGNVLKDAPKE